MQVSLLWHPQTQHWHKQQRTTNYIEQSPCEKLTVTKLAKKSKWIYGISFVGVFTKCRCWSLPLVKWIQSTFSYTISLTSLLIFSYHLKLSSGPLPLGKQTIIFYAFLIYPTRTACPSTHPPRFVHQNNNLQRILIAKRIIMQFPPAAPSLLPTQTGHGTVLSFVIKFHNYEIPIS
jgi:hypothetical protein